MKTPAAFVKLLPLCCGFFLMAAQDECTIHIVTDDEDTCPDVDSVCNLDCELATNDAGCEICECAAGEGEGEGECQSDADCRDGQICALEYTCPPCASDQNDPSTCDVACLAAGRCIDIQPDPCAAVLCSPDTYCVADDNGNAQCIPYDGGCRADDECGPGAFCDFSQCGGETRPDGSNGGGSGAPIAPCETGFCHVIDLPTCEVVRCDQGLHCVDTDFGAQCVRDEQGCVSDDECGPGAHCEQVCGSDPSCPNCDVCMLEGICVFDACPALCGPGSECVISADGTVGCEPIVPPTAECVSDQDCRDGTVCNAADVCLSDPACTSGANGLVACTDVCWGFCVEPQPAGCQDDSQCAQGERCELIESCPACGDPNTDPVCLMPCRVDGFCTAAP